MQIILSFSTLQDQDVRVLLQPSQVSQHTLHMMQTCTHDQWLLSSNLKPKVVQVPPIPSIIPTFPPNPGKVQLPNGLWCSSSENSVSFGDINFAYTFNKTPPLPFFTECKLHPPRIEIEAAAHGC